MCVLFVRPPEADVSPRRQAMVAQRATGRRGNGPHTTHRVKVPALSVKGGGRPGAAAGSANTACRQAEVGKFA